MVIKISCEKNYNQAIFLNFRLSYSHLTIWRSSLR